MHVIFPMAGQAAHAGYKFKPFVKLGDETVIEAVLRPFRAWSSRIERFHFVCLQEHEEDFAISVRLRSLFADLPISVVCLQQPTRGPAATLAEAVRQGGLSGPAVVCDCDHSVDVDPLFERVARQPAVDCAFPIWSLRGEDLRAWSVAACNGSLKVTAIAEKQLPRENGEFVGVVGCYYFAHIDRIAGLVDSQQSGYLSQVINHLLQSERQVEGVRISRAEFFGSSRGLRRAMSQRDQFRGTILCDIDGTVIEHQDAADYSRPLTVLPGSRERLAEWIEQGYHVVLTTARGLNDQPQLEQSLRAADVPFHRLLMGLPSGPRYLINDRKPSAMLMPQVASFEVSRNEGIAHINLNAAAPTVLRRFCGASLADTLLVEDDEKLFVRKRVLKRDQLSLGYAKLKGQYRTLERFSQLGKIVPALYGDHENTLEYYFDMEYLAHHRSLSQLDAEERVAAIEALLSMFTERIYSVRTSTAHSGGDWLQTHMARKVFPRLDAMQVYPALTRMVNAEQCVIGGQLYQGLRGLLTQVLTPPLAERFAPRWLSAIHGDLTFENVLYVSGDVRVIDMDGGDFLDAPELDLGKMFQSQLGRYEQWAHSDLPLCAINDKDECVLQRTFEPPAERELSTTLEHWSRVLGCSTDEVYARGQFYMGLHLIRMLPFRLRVSEEQALHALALAIRSINEACAL